MNESTKPTRSLVDDYEDITRSKDFYITPDGVGREIPGPGSLDTMMVVGDADAFGVRVETEDTILIDESFTRLESYSAHLDHIDAETTAGGERIVSVTNFPYRSSVRCQVKLTGTVTFPWVRGVFTIGKEVDY